MTWLLPFQFRVSAFLHTPLLQQHCVLLVLQLHLDSPSTALHIMLYFCQKSSPAPISTLSHSMDCSFKSQFLKKEAFTGLPRSIIGSSFFHRFSGRNQRWDCFWFFCYCFSAGLLVFLRMILYAIMIHLITYPVALPTLTIEWTGLRRRYASMFSLMILSPPSQCPGSFRPLTYNTKIWRWNCFLLIQHNLHYTTKSQD